MSISGNGNNNNIIYFKYFKSIYNKNIKTNNIQKKKIIILKKSNKNLVIILIIFMKMINKERIFLGDLIIENKWNQLFNNNNQN